MEVKKIGHCCLYIQEGSLNILTDPGMFSEGQDSVIGVDLILITHEHQDHLHLDSVKTLMQNNPTVQILCNKGVAKVLDTAGLSYRLIEDGQSAQFNDVVIEAHGTKHAEIYGDYGAVENTGFLINNRLFYSGDALHTPGKEVEILALPVAGPWLSMAMAIDYAREIKPKSAFPVHDGMLREDRGGFFHFIPQTVLKDYGIDFKPMKDGEEIEF